MTAHCAATLAALESVHEAHRRSAHVTNSIIFHLEIDIDSVKSAVEKLPETTHFSEAAGMRVHDASSARDKCEIA